MTQSKELQNEKLINDLYEKLHWYTFEASDEQFDAEEVDAIVQLLDVLEPLKEDPRYPSDTVAARERFDRRYGVEVEDAGPEREIVEAAAVEEDESDKISNIMSVTGIESGKAGTKKVWKRKKVFVRAGVGVAACLVLMLSVNVGSYALKKKSFFEVVQDGIGRTKVTVTGNIDELDYDTGTAVYYNNWDEVESIIGRKLLQLQYLPKEFELVSICIDSMSSKVAIIAKYQRHEDYVRLEIDIYPYNYSENIIAFDDEWRKVDESEDKEVQYYAKNDQLEACFTYNQEVYKVNSNLSLEEMKLIVKGLLQ